MKKNLFIGFIIVIILVFLGYLCLSNIIIKNNNITKHNVDEAIANSIDKNSLGSSTDKNFFINDVTIYKTAKTESVVRFDLSSRTDEHLYSYVWIRFYDDNNKEVYRCLGNVDILNNNSSNFLNLYVNKDLSKVKKYKFESVEVEGINGDSFCDYIE